VILKSLEIGAKLLERILYDFGIVDNESLVLSMEDMGVDPQQIMQSPYMSPMDMMRAQQKAEQEAMKKEEQRADAQQQTDNQIAMQQAQQSQPGAINITENYGSKGE
jgi:hypothetical protein